MRAKALGGMLMILGCVPWASAAEPPNTIAGLYSDIRYVPEAGDVVGMQVMILTGKSGPWVLFQLAEGLPDEPVLVRARLSGRLVEFAVPDSGDRLGTFRGELKGSTLVGKFSRLSKPVRLLRRARLWK